MRRLGRPTPRDVLAGPVTGLFSIPEGIAYASIGGFNPAAGLYSGVVPGILASVFARTALMVTTLTSAIALSSRRVLAEKGLDPADPANVAALAVVVGAVMLVFGLLRFGSIMNFVSNAVMTGFSAGIALQIIAGVLNDATGYKPQSGNTIGKFVDARAHIGLWHPAAVAVAAGAVAAWAAFHLIKPLKSFAVLLALVVVTAVVAIAHIDVETVDDIATISNSLPPLSVPNFAVMPQLLVGGVAVALVALAQAAGISATVPNPDGSRSNMSGDFTAQGVGNLADLMGRNLRRHLARAAGLDRRVDRRDHSDSGHRGTHFRHRSRARRRQAARHQAGVARRADICDRDADHLRRHHCTRRS